MALGLIHAFREAGLDVPRDVSIVGFDDIRFSRYTDPPLTTVAQPVEDFASAAWRLLMLRLSAGEKGVERVELPCTLRVRESTGPARPRLKAVAEA